MDDLILSNNYYFNLKNSAQTFSCGWDFKVIEELYNCLNN